MDPTTQEVEEYQLALTAVQKACNLIFDEMKALRDHPGRNSGPLYPNPSGFDRWKPVLDARDEPQAIREMRESGKDDTRRKAACGALTRYVIAVNLQACLQSYRAGKRSALFANMIRLKRDLMLLFEIRMRPKLREESFRQLSDSIRSRRVPTQV
ncbi:MAG TPA: hypothetical protein VNL17_14285 [Verrucomicrobiae bacterium]|nr:hypothetical protein [Verrucomicrobiae bacterium]